jgi:Tol biopolymer transport system component
LIDSSLDPALTPQPKEALMKAFLLLAVTFATLAIAPLSAQNPNGLLTLRRLMPARADVTGAPSPDGRYLSYVNWLSYELSVRDLATGESRSLFGRTPESLGVPWFSTFSRDGQRIAFGWRNSGSNRYDLRVVGFDGSDPHVVFSGDSVAYVQPAEWYPDGETLLALVALLGDSILMARVSVTDGSFRVIKTLPFAWTGSLSPDGQWIAYDAPQSDDSYERDIFLIAADGSRETALVRHTTNDLFPVWTPDGSRIVFSSDRTGSLGLWMIEVTDGKPVGPETLVKPDLGPSWPLGFAEDGTYFFGVLNSIKDVYVAELDLATGELLSSPRVATSRYGGSNDRPALSYDGKYLAYVSERSSVPYPEALGSWVITIRSLETGEEREIPLRLSNLGDRSMLWWSPNGNSLLMPASDAEDRTGLYLIDVNTGAISPVVQTTAADPVWAAAWSADGSTVFYSRMAIYGGVSRVTARELDSGDERELYRGSASALAVSPDGMELALIEYGGSPSHARLLVLPLEGGEAGELIAEPGGYDIIDWHYGLAWVPDGTGLLYGKTVRQGSSAVGEVWHVSATDGSRRPTELTIEGGHLRLHPDGRRIAFASGSPDAWEVWVMENFLPTGR